MESDFRPAARAVRRTLAALAVVALPAIVAAQEPARASTAQPHLGTRSVPILERDGLRFKDLNRNGALDPYEDWRLTPDARARDLVRRMTLAEKAGAMMHGTARATGGGPGAPPGAGGGYDLAANGAMIRDAGVNSFITRMNGDPRVIAE